MRQIAGRLTDIHQSTVNVVSDHHKHCGSNACMPVAGLARDALQDGMCFAVSATLTLRLSAAACDIGTTEALRISTASAHGATSRRDQ